MKRNMGKEISLNQSIARKKVIFGKPKFLYHCSYNYLIWFEII